MKHKILLIVLMTIALPLTANAVEGKFSGLMFGDYYYMISRNDNKDEGQNGFWLRRAYLKYDATMSDAIATRLNLEMNSAHYLTAAENLLPKVKDAYLQWKTSDTHKILIGIQGTPTFDQAEKYGYREVEKSPLDFWGFGKSRDFGVGVKGKVSDEFSYHFLAGDNSDNKNETDKKKKAYLALDYNFTKEALFELYLDYASKGAYVIQGLVGYKTSELKLSGLFAYSVPSSAKKYKLLSGQAGYAFNESFEGLARVDLMLDTPPASEGYWKNSTASKATMIIAGVSYAVTKEFHIIPNMESILYSDAAVEKDIAGKMTFYWTF